MKQTLLYALFLVLTKGVFAQTPQAIPYQAAARNSSGAILASTAVSVRFSIHDATADGTVVYSETHTTTTTAQGLFSVNVGQGTPVTGTFSGINWGTNAKYMQVELDPTGGSSYIDMGTQQMMSVPYALYAGTSSSSSQWTTSGSNIHNGNSGNVGIGTATPAARLHVADSSVVFTGIPGMWGEFVNEPIPVNGTGPRLLWSPGRGAFRAGFAYDDQWNADSIGIMSIAMGEGPTASGLNATAIGHFAIASGYSSVSLGESRAYGMWSTAIGKNNAAHGMISLALGESTTASADRATSLGRETIASGENSTAMGYLSNASGINSTAMGNNSAASGPHSTAMGSSVANGEYSTAFGTSAATGGFSTSMGFFSSAGGQTSTSMGTFSNASGENSTAMGSYTTASGVNSTAMGHGTTASGMYSSAMGNYVSTNEKTGSFAIGDVSNYYPPTLNDADNQMMMRFAGGYKLYNDTFATKGLEITQSGSAKYMSDVTGTFTDRSLVDKHYVDSVAAGGSSAGWAASGTNIHNTNTGKVGIGITTPAAKLHVADSSVVFTGPADVESITPGNPPISGPGSRMMWYADKAAFRAGWAGGNEWDKENVGNYSIALGQYNTASNFGSVAIGHACLASGAGSTAIGGQTYATGIYSTAFGFTTAAAGNYSTAFGSLSTAGGNNATAWGYFSNASGNGSLAIGNGTEYDYGGSTTASGANSRSIGYNTTASGNNATAIGNTSNASGINSTAIGFFTYAIGDNSTAIGYYSTASGAISTAMGIATVASGTNSTAMGVETYATGTRSTAMGDRTTASGDFTTAMGSLITTNGKDGSFAIGDASPSTTTQGNDANNQMMMRFAGGYKLYTNSTITVGVSLAPGGNSWATISDRNKKENFAAVDGEAFLRKIAKFNLTSWNYKGQDPATHRHYGPMAQDFYAAFGKDQYGTMGNDTTISQADMEGVSFIAIQALVKENEALKAKINQLENKNSTLSNELNVLKAELTTNLQETNNRMQEIEKLLRKENTAAK